MTVYFQVISPNPLWDCGICFRPLTKDIVAHNQGGVFHPYHRKCIKQWLQMTQNCPNCRVKINPYNLLSVMEKVAFCWKKVAFCLRSDNISHSMFVVCALQGVASTLIASKNGFPSFIRITTMVLSGLIAGKITEKFVGFLGFDDYVKKIGIVATSAYVTSNGY